MKCKETKKSSTEETDPQLAERLQGRKRMSDAMVERFSKIMEKAAEQPGSRVEFSYNELNGNSHCIVTIGQNSVIFGMLCLNLDCLEDLWNKYRNGYWKELFQYCFSSEELLNELGLESVTFDVFIDELDYIKCAISLGHSGQCIFIFVLAFPTRTY